jgi:hypothetical protein
LQIKLKKFALLFAVIIVCFGILELVSFLLLSPAEKKLPASAILSSSHNEYLKDYSLKSGCTFAESIIAHPTLGFVHRKQENLWKRCRTFFKANNIGIISERDLPLVKKKDEFAVLILGGSVAEQLANYKTKDGSYFLEDILNKKFTPPTGKRFTIYNGALGAWAMPSQVNMLMMYGERIDAAISLDGYNESFPVQEGVRHERVPALTYILSFSDRSSLKISGLRFLWAYQYGISHTWLRHSYFFNLSYRIFTGLYQSLIVSPDVIDEFSKGNTEDLNLPLSEAQKWSLDSLQRYMESFHQLGQGRKILTAEFLQPARFYGKVFTAEEKMHREYIQEETFKNIEGIYKILKINKFPVNSLTNVFADERETIYSDHIHYVKVDGYSKGQEIVANAIADELGRLWHLHLLNPDKR